jgi:gluconolactonase
VAVVNTSEGFLFHDGDFVRVTGRSPRLERVVDVDAHEGPVYVAADDALYFTSLPVARPGEPPAATIRRVALDGERFPLEPERVTDVPADVTMPNGMALDREGRLVVCEQGGPTTPALISRVDPVTGQRSPVVGEWRGRELNSPNDVVVADDGAIWFTDPSYGHLQGFRPRPQVGDFVYRWDAVRGTADVVADGFDKPNGIAWSPDGATLYVTDSGTDQGTGRLHPERPHHVLAFDVVAGGRRLTGRRLLAVTAPGFPDGITCDADGRVYVSAASGVLVLSPDGDLLGEILLPGTVNFAFGGPAGNVLFLTTDTAVWAAVLDVTAPRTANTRSARPTRLTGAPA